MQEWGKVAGIYALVTWEQQKSSSKTERRREQLKGQKVQGQLLKICLWYLLEEIL